MIVPLYAPGEWFAVVTDGSIALLPGDTDPGLVQEIWVSLREGGALTEQVHLLLRTGIAHLPPFALLSVQGGNVQAIVRGGVEVDVRTAAGLRVLSAARVSTWTEDIVGGAETVAVRAPGWDGSSAAQALPVLSGVVRAAGVRVELRSADVHDDGSDDDESAPVWDALGDDDGADDIARVDTARLDPARVRELAGVADEVAPVVPVAPAPVPGVAAPAPAVAEPVTPAPADVPADVPGGEDHDGMTVLSSDVVALRRQLPDWAGDAVPGPLAVPAPQT
ncbi:MAG TPA: hypothetical protein VGK35_03830, partial [Actinotalea sp.]